MEAQCLICQKHQGKGPLAGGVQVWSDGDVVVFHGGPGVIGHLFIETWRHAPYLADLTSSEAAAVGRAAAMAARALRAELDCEMVHTAVAGTHIAHFHQHVMVRHPGTPPEIGWWQVDEWDGAPQGDVQDVHDLCARLRTHFAGSGGSGPGGGSTEA